MGTHNLRQCHLVVSDLIERRRGRLARLRTGQQHIDVFEALRAELDQALDGVAQLGVDDPLRPLIDQHVEVSGALGSTLEGARRNPLAPPAERAAADRVYRLVVEGRLGLGVTAGARAQAAELFRRQRPEVAADLRRLPAQVGALVDRWVELGDAIRDALSERTNVDAPAQRSALELTRDVAHALARLRRAVRVELELDPGLPASLEAQVLGFADTLAPPRRRRRAAPEAEIDEVEAVAPIVEPPPECPPAEPPIQP